jgi:acetyl esterase/lipase
MRIRATTVLLTLFCTAIFSAGGQTHHRRSDHSSESRDDRTNCFDASDQNEIRLWEGRAPGAVGDDPCRDVPFLKVYSPGHEGRDTRTAIIVIPGGGYDRLSDKKEQAPVGEYFSRQLHVTTFVLFYRLVQADGSYRYPVPMWDGQRALKLVRSRAEQFNIAPDRIGLFGFSAGGHLASTLALHSASNFDLPQHDAIDDAKGRPDFLGLGYPVISMLPDQFASPNSLAHLLFGYHGHDLDHLEHYLSGQEHITEHTSPVFLFESLDDQRISSQNSVIFAESLRAANIPAEVHLFKHGVHGAGLAEDIPEEQDWPEMFHHWLDWQGLLR